MLSSSSTLLILILLFLELFLTVMVMAMIAKTQHRDSILENKAAWSTESDHARLEMNCKKYALTSREIEILQLLRGGLPYKIIANQLNISIRTVTTHVSNMFTKVNVTNKMELVSRICEGNN